VTTGVPEFEFEQVAVRVATTDEVKAAYKAGRSRLVVGQRGSGKTYAVRQAVNGAVWIDLARGPLQEASFFVDLARQVEGGRAILEALVSGRAERAFEAAGAELGDRVLVIDRGERLAAASGVDWDDPSRALWAAAQDTLRRWLFERAKAKPTVVISGRPLSHEGWPDDAVIRHVRPVTWPLKLTHAEGGFRDWAKLADRVNNLPGALLLARALVPLLSASEFAQLLDELDWEAEQLEEESPGARAAVTIPVLERRFAVSAPRAWRRVLAVVDALEGLALTDVAEALKGSPDDRGTLLALAQIGLVDEHRGRISVLPAVKRALGGAGRSLEEARPLLRHAANRLRDSVNDRKSLEPAEAARVFRAHAVYVRLGDNSEAIRTARLHVGGLVDLARRTSLLGRELPTKYEEARTFYLRISDMLPERGAAGADSTALRRLRSYVTHYAAYNGKLADLIPNADVLESYQEAVRDWPENALWRQRLISQCLELGRLEEATRAVEDAYRDVRPHPLRDGYLRVQPAWTALKSGSGDFGLWLVQPVIDLLGDTDPGAAQALRDLLDCWESGVELATLRHQGGLLVFNSPAVVRVRQEDDVWHARVDASVTVGTADGPHDALQKVADRLADDARRLLREPTWALSERDLRQKARVISIVDVLNSDIGMAFDEHRWLLGRIEDLHFIPIQAENHGRLPIAPSLTHGGLDAAGLYMGRVPIRRDGSASGAVDRLTPVGSGRRLDELLQALRRVGADEAA